MEIVNKPKVFKEELPNSTTVLVLGILSLILCWCYGLFGFILGIIAIALSTAPKKMYAENPDLYEMSSVKNLNAGRICAIIGVCIASLWIILLILFFIGIISFAGLAGLSGLCI